MEERDEVMNAAEPAEAADAVNTAEASGSDRQEEIPPESEMTLSGWLWRLCVPIIPLAGIIIYVVLLCMWAFGNKETESMRVWAKAALIATIIKIVIVGLILLILQLNLHLFDPLTAILKRIF